MKKEELKYILDQHTRWLASYGGEGVKANLKRSNLKGVNLEGANLAESNLSRASLEGTNLKGADLEKANLEEANLEWANLEGANLKGVNLEGADLRWANLKGANLKGASLKGVRVFHTDIIIFYLGWHVGFAHFGSQYETGSYVKIGCRGYSLEYWLKHYTNIGRKARYSDSNIKMYGSQLKALKEMRELDK